MDRILQFFLKTNKRWFYPAAYVILILPMLVLMIYTYFMASDGLTKLTFSNRHAIAFLAANNLKENFDHLADLGISFASRIIVREAISDNKWDEAIAVLKNVPNDFPEISEVFLADKAGNLKSITGSDQSIVGKNFAYRDWYKGISKNGWKPYVSEIYKRANTPYYSTVAVAVPIKSDSNDIIGILVEQISINSLLEWTKEIDVGLNGFVYFVDKNGHVAGHPRISAESEIIDFSSVPIVQKVLKGQSGIEVNYNPIDKEERLADFDPVPEYGWGAIATQPTINAFAERQEAQNLILKIFGAILAVYIILIWSVLRSFKLTNNYRLRQETFLQSIGDAVMALDRNFVITLFNPAAERLTGFSTAEVIGKPMRDIIRFVTEKDKKENIGFIEEAMLFGKNREMANHTVLITKSGAEIPVGDSAAPIFDDKGIVSGAIIVFRDITRDREIDILKDNFVAIASHELRTPMTAISGFADMIISGAYGRVPESLKEPLGYIEQGSDRLIKMVNDMLNISRIESGMLKFNFNRLNISEILQQSVSELEPIANKKGIKLNVEVQSVPSVQGDSDKVKQVIINLIGNSIKFTEKGSIVASIGKTETHVEISVTDTGIGMSNEDQKKLFTKFVQIERQKIGQQGTGLGLYVSRELARKMGGDIRIAKSEPGQGSTFVFSLPLDGTDKAKEVKDQLEKEGRSASDQKPIA